MVGGDGVVDDADAVAPLHLPDADGIAGAVDDDAVALADSVGSALDDADGVDAHGGCGRSGECCLGDNTARAGGASYKRQRREDDVQRSHCTQYWWRL